MKFFSYLMMLAFICSCAHSPKGKSVAKKKKKAKSDQFDFSIASEKDFASPLFVEGYKFRFSQAFERPLGEEEEKRSHRVAKSRP